MEKNKHGSKEGKGRKDLSWWGLGWGGLIQPPLARELWLKKQTDHLNLKISNFQMTVFFFGESRLLVSRPAVNDGGMEEE